MAKTLPFVPILEAEKALYKFDLKTWFYLDETTRQKDLAELKELTGQITGVKPVINTNAMKLLGAVVLKQRMGIIADRLQAYGGLQLAAKHV